MAKLFKPIKSDWENLLNMGRIEDLKWEGDSLVGFTVINGYEEKEILIQGTLAIVDDKDSGKYVEPIKE